MSLVDVVIGRGELVEWRGTVQTLWSSPAVYAIESHFVPSLVGHVIEGPGIPAGTRVAACISQTELAITNPSRLREDERRPLPSRRSFTLPASRPPLESSWIGDDRLRAITDDLRQLAAEMQAEGRLPADETLTFVTSLRPDGHGRAVVFALDLLGANEDLWSGTELLSQAWTDAQFRPDAALLAPTTEGTE